MGEKGVDVTDNRMGECGGGVPVSVWFGNAGNVGLDERDAGFECSDSIQAGVEVSNN